MPPLKKTRLVVKAHPMSERAVIDALAILTFVARKGFLFKQEEAELKAKYLAFQNTYVYSYFDALGNIREIYPSIDQDAKVLLADQLYKNYLYRLEKEPVKLLVDGKQQWVFQGYVYGVNGEYSDEQIRLLILEDFDKERRFFEKLKAKFDYVSPSGATSERPRIPESVRVEVWRRDGGKCARCGSRERLEYDHIVPVSKGGSNTARNIELLCEKCNRSKSDNVV